MNSLYCPKYYLGNIVRLHIQACFKRIIKMLLAKLKIVRRLLSIWSHRKIIVHNYFRLAKKICGRKILGGTVLFFYRRKMVVWNNTINNMPVSGQEEVKSI